jgi:hypothetical protein
MVVRHSMLLRFTRSSPLPRIAAAIVLVAFALLTSIAASHLHVGADQDQYCSLCAAFGAGKLKTPSAGGAAARPLALSYWRLEGDSDSQLAHSAPVMLPPSCGPPRIA